MSRDIKEVIILIGMTFMVILITICIFILMINNFAFSLNECNKQLCKDNHGSYFINECFNSPFTPCSDIQLYGNCELDNGTIIKSYCNISN